jgi:hypothetical protein
MERSEISTVMGMIRKGQKANQEGQGRLDSNHL